MGTNQEAVLSDRDPPLARNDGVPSMSPRTLTIDDSVLADDLVRIIAACERFEADWNAGRPTPIEDELAAAQESVQRARLFREL